MLLSIVTLCLGALTGSELLLTPAQTLATEGVLYVDARSAEACAAGHIPGARHVDSATLSEERDGVVGLLKPVKEVVALLAEAGVEPSQHLVVYAARHDADDLKNATRLFWILEYLGFERVSVLDGGFARWQAEGHEVVTGMPEARVLDAKHWTLQTRDDLFATRAEVIDMLQHGNGRVMDLRTPEEYAGLEKKPFVAKAGQIPGAYNLPVADLIEPAKDAAGAYCTLKSFDKVEERVSKKAEVKAMPVITYCNSGRDASVGYWAYRVAGFEQVSVYDGSMAEWGQKDAMALGAGESTVQAAPVATEE
jgi:thiosulfate/3-mercaptopyruvate sulfurtransferase